MEIEIFKRFPLSSDVKVGNKGTIIRPNGRLASKAPDNVGYLKLSVRVDGVLKSFKQHRIVALTWIENPLNLPEVNHLDGNKLNNCVENLEWSTHRDNINHGHATGLFKSKKGQGKGRVTSEETKAKQSAAKLGKRKTTNKKGGKWVDAKEFQLWTELQRQSGIIF